jgi:hypothetical protein
VFNREPALIIALAGAVLAVAVEFGLDLTSSQQAAISALILAIVGVAVRSQVYAPASVTVEED